jgi:hypothetical protein
MRARAQQEPEMPQSIPLRAFRMINQQNKEFSPITLGQPAENKELTRKSWGEGG